MILRTCGHKERRARGSPIRVRKPATPSTAAGSEYEIKDGERLPVDVLDLGRPRGHRAEVRSSPGADEVPILVLDGGEVVSDSGAMAGWAKDTPGRAQTAAA